MLPKAHLTSHSRMSGSRWVITPSWLSESWLDYHNFFLTEQPFIIITKNCHIFYYKILLLLFYILWTMVLEKTLESPLDCKEIQPVHSEGDQPWDFFGRNDAKAETPVLWPLDAKSWLIGKDSDAGRDWGQEEKGMTEDEVAGWQHWLDGRGSQWTLGVGDGQGGLVCCDSWGRKESDTTERLIWSDLRRQNCKTKLGSDCRVEIYM